MERSQDADRAALIALTRFGLGPRPGDIERVRIDPAGAVLADLASAPVDLPASGDLPVGGAALGAVREARRWTRETLRHVADLGVLRQISNPVLDDATPAGPPTMLDVLDLPVVPETEAGADPAAPVDPRYDVNQLYEEIDARIEHYSQVPVGFTERLVLFWSNHFAVGAKNADLNATVGALEREAIRPNVRGTFGDMMLAVARHPAMLLYLDNSQSYGPSSELGQQRGRGLNENLAREILELHTLGVDGGYTQADVTAFARILTGWMVSLVPGSDGFKFDRRRHEPGDHTVLGKVYPAGGVEQGEAVLADLVRNPATAHHVARKLAVYFVSDDPPPALVARLETVFRETGGDLAAVSRALVEAPESWQAPATKLRLPQEFVIGACRLTGQHPDPREFSVLIRSLGQPVWDPPAPNGFPATSDAWVSPKGIMGRLAVSDRLARSLREADPQILLTAAFGETVTPTTRRAVLSAESRSQAVAILLMAPEFQWR